MSSLTRKLRDTPVVIVAGLIVFSLIQIYFHSLLKNDRAVEYQPLNQPLQARQYQALAFGSDRLLSYALMLSVQLHDNQIGKHIGYQHVNYETLSRWLLTIYELNPLSDYPAFLTTRVYSQVSEPAKIVKLIEVTQHLFTINPVQHWRRMTEACLLAKHQLKDLSLALTLAKQVADLPASIELPHWARDMKLILLDELNQLESAQLLISSMLQSGEVKDNDEIRFLKSRLLMIQQKMLENEQNRAQ